MISRGLETAFVTRSEIARIGGLAAGLIIASQSAALAIDLSGITTTQGAAVTESDPVNLVDNATIDTTGGGQVPAGAAITFASTIDGTYALNLISGTSGVVALGGPVGGTAPLQSLTITGNTVLGSGATAVITLGDQGYQRAVVVGPAGEEIFTNKFGGITFYGPITLAGTTDITVNGNVTFGGTVGSAALPAGTLTVNGNTALNGGGVTTTGTQTYGGAVTLGNDTNLIGTTVTFAGPITETTPGSNSLTVTGNANLNGIVNGLQNLTITDNASLNGGAVTTTGTQNYGGPVTLGVDTTLTSTAAGNITFGSTIQDQSGLTVSTAGVATINGVISGTGSLTKAGTGTLILMGQNTYTGTTTVGAGVLEVQPGAALGSRDLTVAGGTLILNGDQTVGNLSGVAAGTIQLNGGTLTAGGSTSTSFQGTIEGTGGLTKTGSGTLTLTSPNSYTGTTIINSGTLVIGAGGGLTDTSNVAVNAGSLLLEEEGIYYFFKHTDGSHQLTVNGGTLNLGSNAELTVTGTFLQTGGTTQVDGTLAADLTKVVGGVLQGSGTVNGPVKNLATITGQGAGITLGGAVAGSGNYQGTVIFNGSLSLGDPALVTGDQLVFGSGSNLMLQIGGLARGTQYDAIDAGLVDLLDGTLDISFIDLGAGMFDPVAGDYFDLIDAASFAGNFGTLDLPGLDPGLGYTESFVPLGSGEEAYRLSVVSQGGGTPVPEPASIAILLAGLAGIGAMTRRCRALRYQRCVTLRER